MPGEQIFHVVVNAEQQCATWFADRELPEGWHAPRGGRPQFLTRVSDLWSGMAPLCLRRRDEDA